MEPLVELGFISVTSGRIVVHRRTVEQVQAVEAKSDAELDRLEHDVSRSKTLGEPLDPEYQALLKYQRAGINPPNKCIGWVGAQTDWNDEPETEA